MKCHCCGSEIAPGTPAERGMLINKVATMGARVVDYRSRLRRFPPGIGGPIGEARKAIEQDIAEAERERDEAKRRLVELEFPEATC